MKTSDFDHQDTERIIGGAVFALGVLILAASFVVGILAAS